VIHIPVNTSNTDMRMTTNIKLQWQWIVSYAAIAC